MVTGRKHKAGSCHPSAVCRSSTKVTLHSSPFKFLYFTVFQTSLYLNKNMKLMLSILDLKDTLNIT